MRILIGCEESQAVTKEFRKLGFDAFSCDLKPCSGGHPEYHIQGDVIEAINSNDWDFIGLHPVCTKMTLSGNRHYAKGKPKNNERIESVEWTIALWNIACKKAKYVYMENPLGAMNGDNRLPKPQVIQPYYFGDSAKKTTCLWLSGLPFLYHNKIENLFNQKTTHVDKGKMIRLTYSDGRVKNTSEWEYECAKMPVDIRAEMRSKTFPGIAKAMAEQWGDFLNEEFKINENIF